jgi:hypothetical protein
MQRAEGARRCCSAKVEEREVILGVMENWRSLRISHGEEDGYRRRRKKGF